MKKRFYSKNKKKKKRVKKIIFLLLFCFSLYLTYQYLNNNLVKKDQKELVKILLSKKVESNLLDKMFSFLFYDETKLVNSILEKNYQNLNIKQDKKNQTKTTSNIKKEPVIYIYNTHQTEQYSTRNFIEESVNPTVLMNNYILEEIFTEAGFDTLIEEKNIKEVLNNNGWNYAGSYKASRIFLEDAKKNHPSLKYFIDMHRDSVGKNLTTTTINDKSYAKILFIVGLENPNYAKNLAFTERIDEKLKNKYPTLSRGIYKKQGAGVNGVYNQDFSPNTILVEMGGPENTIDEVLNSTLAFAECFLEVIKEDEL